MENEKRIPVLYLQDVLELCLAKRVKRIKVDDLDIEFSELAYYNPSTEKAKELTDGEEYLRRLYYGQHNPA